MIAPDLLTRATAAQRDVDADPRGFAATAAALVTEARAEGAVEALVVALCAEAWAHRARLADHRAKSLLDEAAALARRHHLHRRLGTVLVTRAAVNHELGALGSAQRDLDAARGLLDEAASLQHTLQQAALHQNIGRLAAAAGLYRSLLAEPATPVDVVGKVANNLALIEAQRGRTDVALQLLDRAAAAAEQVGPALSASVVDSRGQVCVHAGRLTEGLRLFDEAAARFAAAGLPTGELFTGYADVLLDLRLLPEATAAAARAVDVLESGGVPLMTAEARLRVARLALRSGDLAAAAATARRASDDFRRQHRRAWVARADVVAVEAALAAGQAGAGELRTVRAAAADLDRSGVRSEAVHAHLTAGRVALALRRPRPALADLALARSMSRRAPVLTRLDGRVAAALECDLLGDEGSVLRHARAGLRDLVRHRSALPSAELRALASGHGAELGDLGLAVLLRRGSPRRVLEWMERTRAAALTTLAAAATADSHGRDVPASVAPAGPAPRPAAGDGGDDLAELRAVHARLASDRDPGGGTRAELLGRQGELEARLRRATWTREPVGAEPASTHAPGSHAPGSHAAASVAGPAPVAAPGALRAALAGRVLVEYGVHEGEVFAVVVRPRSSAIVRLGRLATVEELTETLVFALRRLTLPRPAAASRAARASADAALSALRAALLGPLALPPDAEIVVVPVRGLHGLPWSALHDGAVGVAPSAAFWARTATAAPPRHPGPTLLAAGPGLPGAVDEVRALAGLHGCDVVLSPPASTVDAVVAALDGADLAHLACHGSLRADNPTFSALRLSDGPLTLHEMESRGVAPRRVVLASCESGAHVGYAGDEVLGFVAALMARGTVGVLASTLVVSDVASVALMCGVHERLLTGATLATALHAARADLDTDDPRTFVAWSAYTAYGAG